MGEEARTIAAGLCQTPPPVKCDPALRTFNHAKTLELLDVAQHVLCGARALVEFIDDDRTLARMAGVETIGIEVSAIVGGDQIVRIVDAIEESIRINEPASISLEGLGEMKRLEKLLAEASNNINRFTTGGYRLSEASRLRAERESERRRLEIHLQEQRIEAMKRQHELHGTLERQEAQSLGRVDLVNDADLLGADKSADSSSSSWGAILGIGTVAVVVVMVAYLAMKS